MKIFLKKLTAVTCIAAMLLAAAAVNTSAAAKINYSFSGDEQNKPGYAEGTITLTGLDDGKYFLFWANGEKALDGYYEISEMNVKSGFAKVEFGEHTAIPVDAEKLIVCKDKNNPTVASAAAVYDIPAEKRLGYSSKDINYTFMSYSDIHIDEASSVFYRHSELHWQKALETAARRGADFIVTSGDNITNGEGPAKEFDKYQEILADSDFNNPVYESDGNHELRVGTPESMLSAFMSATGVEGDKPYFMIEEPKSGDIFIFCALETNFNPYDEDEFSDEQLDWFEGIINKYYDKGRNIYVVQHALIESYGAGDDENNYYDVPLSVKHKSTVRFRDILRAHPKVVWMSGHTHIAFKYGYNYSNMNDTACHMIHNSSVCCPTIINESSHKLSYVGSQGDEYKDFTEGYYVQVFDDEIIYNGENLYHDKIYPLSCYIMEGCRSAYTARRPEPVRKIPDLLADKAAFLATFESEVIFPGSRTGDSGSADYLAGAAKELLGKLYTLSSYDCYQRLKKTVAEADKAEDTEEWSRRLIEEYTELSAYNHRGDVTIYFTNSKDWDKVYANLSSAKTEQNGVPMTFVKKDENGHGIYKISVNRYLYSQIEFSNGDEKEVSDPQAVPVNDNVLYKLNAADIIAPYFCIEDDYK